VAVIDNGFILDLGLQNSNYFFSKTSVDFFANIENCASVLIPTI